MVVPERLWIGQCSRLDRPWLAAMNLSESRDDWDRRSTKGPAGRQGQDDLKSLPNTEMAQISLPIDCHLAGLVDALRHTGCATVEAPTGSGKTTRVPPALLAERSGKVLVLEPRRVAARAAARRMSSELGQPLAHTVGYQVRFDRQIGPRTRLEVLTEGILLRRLQDDPWLESVSTVVVDEFHERHLDSDLALAMLRRLQLDAREDLWLVVMSATLDGGAVSQYLGGCPRIESDGRLHPVRIELARPSDRSDERRRLVTTVERAIGECQGDVLVFLPGLAEIRRAEKDLTPRLADRGIRLSVLFGDLPPERQDAVLRADAPRQVVLSTNLAESSITLPNVDAVVDTGWARVPRYDPGAGLDRLELERISSASADQRAGRAGRVRPGACYRLWTEGEHRAFVASTSPEIERVDLAGAVLQLHAWGESDVHAFPWYEPPPSEALERADRLLSRLGALDASGVSALGRRMSELPLAPRLARFLLEGTRLGQGKQAALGAALLAERDPFRAERGPIAHHSDSDLRDRCLALEAFEARHQTDFPIGRLGPGAARHLLLARDQLFRQVSREMVIESEEPGAALGRALVAAFPDRIARRRPGSEDRAVLVGGQGVRLSEHSAVREAELLVCFDLTAGRRGTRSEAIARRVAACLEAWLPKPGLRTETSLEFDHARARVRGLLRRLYEDLVLQETPIAVTPSAESDALLEQAAVSQLEEALDLTRDSISKLCHRLAFLRGARPELELPVCDDALWRELLPDLCRGRLSFAELRKAPLYDWLNARLTVAQRRALESQAPERLELPNGKSVRLRYRAEGPPVLAARIQELFGLRQTPIVAGGRVRVLCHLLAPNGRPQQITDDLESFWDTTYAVVRKELRRRYPKHAWPEDPRVG